MAASTQATALAASIDAAWTWQLPYVMAPPLPTQPPVGERARAWIALEAWRSRARMHTRYNLPAGVVAFALLSQACGESLESRKAAALEQQRRAGDQDFGVRRLTEVERIENLLKRLSVSGVGFIKNGREMSSESAARMLRRQYERHGDRISTAEQFVGMLGTRGRYLGRAYEIRSSDGSLVPAHDWLMTELALIDPLPTAPSATPGTDSSSRGGLDTGAEVSGATASGETALQAQKMSAPGYVEATPTTIAAALEALESLDVRFVIDADEVSRRQELDAKAFVKLLRRKSRWLGADINTLPPWIDEIASTSFKSLQPYRVVLGDASMVDVGPWLRARWTVPTPGAGAGTAETVPNVPADRTTPALVP